MNVTRRIVISVLMIAFVISGCGLNSATPTAAPPLTAAPTATLARNTVIVLGEVSNEPSKKIERLQPLTDYVGKRLDKVGVTSAQIKIAPDSGANARAYRRARANEHPRPHQHRCAHEHRDPGTHSYTCRDGNPCVRGE